MRRYQVRALRVAQKFCGDSRLAEDIAQNAFLEIYKALPGYRPQGKFGAYLWRTVVNHSRMARRSSRSRQRLDEQVWKMAQAEPGLSETQILERERRREVDKALAQLSDKLRTVVVLRFAAGLSHQEIAETLGLPLGTVKRRLFDGLEKLRQEVECV